MRITNHALKDFLAHNRSSCFYFDLKEIDKNLAFLQSLSDEHVQFIFPVKSFNRVEVLRLASERLSGFDVSNAEELRSIEGKKCQVLWSSSPSPWRPLQEQPIFMDGAHAKASWCDKAIRSLRVNLGSSRFGSSLEQVPNAQVSALHFHHGDENTTLAALNQAITQIAQTIEGLHQITHVNLGGSFGALEQEEIATLVSLARRELPRVKVIFEPGRWIARNAGLLLGKVEDLNVIDGKGHVLTSLSRDCHMRWYQEHFKMSFHSLGLSSASFCSDVVIGGATCHEADVIGRVHQGQLHLAVGDIIVLSDATGYSLAWNHSFNGIQAAEVVFFD